MPTSNRGPGNSPRSSQPLQSSGAGRGAGGEGSAHSPWLWRGIGSGGRKRDGGAEKQPWRGYRLRPPIHAGWRGTLARIVHKTIQEMAFAYHTEPKKLKAVIGPGISLEHFEVGDEVYEAFEQAAFPMEEIAEQRPNAAFSVDIAERERLAAEGNIVQPLKWHINLPLCNKQILLHCGVAEENIQDCGICTFAHSDEFFSARKLGIESGRIYTGILMK